MLTNVDKYISRFAVAKGQSADGRSHYYQLGDKIIRVSDHIGMNSEGCFHIIVKPNGYLIHHPETGTINICGYRQVQEFIRSLEFIPVGRFKPQKLIVGTGSDESNVLGVPMQAFTEGQLNGIKLMVRKVKKEQGIKKGQNI